jgi:hypothetical protein
MRATPSRRFASERISRRALIGGACAMCGLAGSSAQAEIPRLGCSLPPGEFEQHVDRSSIASAAIDNYGSGDRLFDQALSVTLLNISKVLTVLPGFVFTDRVQNNAFASPNTVLGRPDGSVVFGRSLFQTIMARAEHPEIGVATVCAHEFGHILQFKRGLYDKLVVGEKVKRLELHADYLAGYFAGNHKLGSPSFPAAVFGTTLFALGDNDFTNPDHHGTQRERGDAVVAGFEAGYREKLPIDAALQKGVDYVQQVAL